MRENEKHTGMVTGREKASYGLYFVGQNVFYCPQVTKVSPPGSTRS